MHHYHLKIMSIVRGRLGGGTLFGRGGGGFLGVEGGIYQNKA